MPHNPVLILFRTLVLLLVIACIWGPTRSGAQVSQLRTEVVLDRLTFRSEDYRELQGLADRVAAQVDSLIPGQMSEFVGGPILCYQVHEGDTVAETELHAPVTISADFRYAHEPVSVVPGQTRIALYGINPLRGQRFVYQLAHELAHVKMGVRLDNYLVETFAMAVSLEVSRRMGIASYADGDVESSMHQLPDSIQSLYARKDFPALRRYWQEQASLQKNVIEDRPFQTLGTVLMMQAEVPWAKLLGIGLDNGNCPLNNPPGNITICAPDLARMHTMQSTLKALGYPSSE